MMGFLTCDDYILSRWPKLVLLGRSCSEPFSCLHQDIVSMQIMSWGL